VDYMGRPVVSILHIDEEYNKTYRFFREDAGIWQEMLDWNLEAESGVSFLKCALDSSGYPHIAHGATGDLEFSGQFDYSYFDGTSWHTPLRNIISSRVQIELDADDKAHFMFFNLDLQSTFWCVPSGDGYYFRLEQEYGELGDFMLHPSGSPVYTCSEIDVYNLQQFGNNPCVNYCWDQIYYIDDYEQEDMHGIESAFDLDSAESPHICFKRNSYDVSEAITHDKLGYAIRDGYDWNVEWVSQGCGVAYHNLKMLLDAEDQPVIIAVKPM